MSNKKIVPSILAFLMIILALYIYRFHHGLSYDQAHWGAFGDLIGGLLGPILNFIVVMVALKTLSLQREEIVKQEEVINEQRLEAEEQKRLQRLASFESNFYNKLSILNDFVLKVQHQITKTDCGFSENRTYTEYITGYACFRLISDQLSSSRRSLRQPTDSQFVDDIVKDYNTTYNTYGHIIGQYFRRLYDIVEFVHNQQNTLFTNDTQAMEQYIRSIRSLLSVDQLNLLFYNVHTPYGSGFLEFVNRYRLLKGIIPTGNTIVGHDLSKSAEFKIVNKVAWE